MARTIAITNPKGGVGRTNTALRLSLALAQMHNKVLAVDLDPQGTLSAGLGLDSSQMQETIATALTGAAVAVQAVIYPVKAYLDVLPANLDLASVEMALAGKAESELRLHRLLEPVRSWYDLVLVDCPRGLGPLTVNALCASQEVLIPARCEPEWARGIRLLLTAIRQIQAGPNPGLERCRVLPILDPAGDSQGHEVLAQMRAELGELVLDLVIQHGDRRADAVPTVQAMGAAAETETDPAYRKLAWLLSGHSGDPPDQKNAVARPHAGHAPAPPVEDNDLAEDDLR